MVAAVASGDQDGAQEELGDVLFTLVVVGRGLGPEPERALHAANQRFRRRFTLMEEQASREGRALETLSIEEWLAWWANAKKALAEEKAVERP